MHGHARTEAPSPTYTAWTAMRYYNRDAVCERWSDFEAFLADMGTKQDDTRLVRIDRSRNYEPGNVEWRIRGGLRRIRDAGRKREHGHTWQGGRSRTYESWSSMIARCTNSANRSYFRYGGRGITVCERWRDFRAFLADMGERPEGTTLDRINNEGNYEPDNCRWATASEQRRNRRLDGKPCGDGCQCGRHRPKTRALAVV